MKYSDLFPKTIKQVPAGAESINHQYLVRGGFMDQLMAGSWTLLPLGWRVVSKINKIIREEMNAIGGQEMLMPLLHPKEVWERSGRWDKPDVQEIMYQFKDNRGREVGLAITHEEIVMDLIGKHVESYKDLPVKVYHFSNKFRNELRSKGGILRGREFMMKDLYSAHISEEDMYDYYEVVKSAYTRIFNRIGLATRIVEASGGIFTEKYTHEFQVECLSGEDVIYYCDKCSFAQNKEIFRGNEGDKCPNCDGVIKAANSIEVGNIFPLGTKFSQDMEVFYRDEQGKNQPIWFASYGIGPTRVMGTIVEVFHDDKGIIWPENVAPFQIHLVGLDLDNEEVNERAEEVYQSLTFAGMEVLFDDRKSVSAGEKFADADLIGVPFRAVISKRTAEKLEVKKREAGETWMLDIKELVDFLAPKSKSFA